MTEATAKAAEAEKSRSKEAARAEHAVAEVSAVRNGDLKRATAQAASAASEVATAQAASEVSHQQLMAALKSIEGQWRTLKL